MADKYKALIDNGTRRMVTPPLLLSWQASGAGQHLLRRDLQSGCQAGGRPQHRRLVLLANSPVGREERLSSQTFGGNRVLPTAVRLRRPHCPWLCRTVWSRLTVLGTSASPCKFAPTTSPLPSLMHSSLFTKTETVLPTSCSSSTTSSLRRYPLCYSCTSLSAFTWSLPWRTSGTCTTSSTSITQSSDAHSYHTASTLPSSSSMLADSDSDTGGHLGQAVDHRLSPHRRCLRVLEPC
jgi:hypothetical protein